MCPWPLTFNPLAACDLFAALHLEVFHFTCDTAYALATCGHPIQSFWGFFLSPPPTPIVILSNRASRIVIYSVCLLLTHLLPCSILIMTLWHFYDVVLSAGLPSYLKCAYSTFIVVQYQHDVKVCILNSKLLFCLSHARTLMWHTKCLLIRPNVWN